MDSNGLTTHPTATALGVHEGRNRSATQSVAADLAAREALLIFDNFEHLQPAAGFLSELLGCAPGLHVLVTSRAVLHLYGEHEFVVSPLPAPKAEDLAAAMQATSVRLFCERSQAARSGFRLTPDLLPVVVEICRRLDGLPLAIELAAARLKLFSPQELLQRMDRRLPLLSQGPSDLPLHDQVLESAIAWSYGLLSASESLLLNRMAVFMGGFTLTAVEGICPSLLSEEVDSAECEAGRELPKMAHDLTMLLDHSLLLHQGVGASPGSRFVMLETIREYAWDRLRDSGELAMLQRRHAAYFTAWAEQAMSHLYGPEQAAWLKYMQLDADNLRAALGWSLDAGENEMAARLACALAVFWRRRGFYSEGRGWLEQVLVRILPDCLPGALRARTLQAAGSLAYRQGDWPCGRRWLEESLALYCVCADQAGVARVLFDLGWIAIDQGDWADAARLNQESLALAQGAGDPLGVYRALTNLGWTWLCIGERGQAAALFAEAYEIAQRVGHTKGIAVSLANLGWITLYQDDWDRAAARAAESLQLCYQLGEREVIAECLEILAFVATQKGQLERAACLSGAAQAIWQGLHVVRPPTHHSTATNSGFVASMRQELPPAVYESARQAGQTMSLDAILGLVLENGLAYVDQRLT